MKQRLLVAAIGVPLLILVLVFLPPLATGILVAAIAGAAAYELLHTACKRPNELYGLTILYAALTALMVFSITAVKSLAIDWPQILYPAAAFLYLMGLFFFAVRMQEGGQHLFVLHEVDFDRSAAFSGFYKDRILCARNALFPVGVKCLFCQPAACGRHAKGAQLLIHRVLVKRKLAQIVR